MFRSTADCKADLQRFLKRVVATDTVWYLTSKNGTAGCPSNAEPEEDTEPPTVLLFFSDAAYARRAQSQSCRGHTPKSMTLFDFMYRWLPGMSRDGVLAGPNWTGDLIGLELDPFELREALEACMTRDHLQRHQQLYEKLSGPGCKVRIKKGRNHHVP
jgi:hypothetical protein